MSLILNLITRTALRKGSLTSKGLTKGPSNLNKTQLASEKARNKAIGNWRVACHAPGCRDSPSPAPRLVPSPPPKVP
eukprot:743294-Pelagomonas_calceolata.AAC.1